MKHYLCFIYLLLASISILAQGKDIYLANASFEGEPDDATVPVGWFACAPATTPDILPGPWGVYQEATDGETFVGLITRYDGTYESIGQRLSGPLKAKECYSFSMDLAFSNTYAGYNNPIKVRVWASKKRGERGQLIAKTDFIENLDWETHNFTFTAEQNYYYIMIEAYYKDKRFSHQGNILIDNFSRIKWCTRA
ncbi:MAG: hypothetical protein AAF847_00545 [Bacteroidota bacterium]